MKKTISVLLALILILIPLQTLAYAKDTIYTVNISVKFHQTEARAMLSRVNSFRTGSDAWYWNSTNSQKIYVSGRTALEYDYELEKVAMQRAAEIAVNYDHTRPDNTNWYSIYPEYYSAAENIAFGFDTEKLMFEGWKEDNDNYAGQGHRRTMLNENVTSVGIACVEYEGYKFWVQEFRGRNYKTDYTKPNDSTTIMSVDIAASNIKNCTITSSLTGIANVFGGTADVPGINAKISTTFRSKYSDMDCNVSFTKLNWTSDNNNIAKISGNSIIFVSPGQTTIRATICGKKVAVTVTVISQKGDVNEDSKINSSDALMILKHSVGMIKIPDSSFFVADVNADNKINSSDALLILKYSVGAIKSL